MTTTDTSAMRPLLFVITHDVERLATFWEQVTGLPPTRPVPVFAELKTPAGTIAIGAPATVGMLGGPAVIPRRAGRARRQRRVLRWRGLGRWAGVAGLARSAVRCGTRRGR